MDMSWFIYYLKCPTCGFLFSSLEVTRLTPHRPTQLTLEEETALTLAGRIKSFVCWGCQVREQREAETSDPYRAYVAGTRKTVYYRYKYCGEVFRG